MCSFFNFHAVDGADVGEGTPGFSLREEVFRAPRALTRWRLDAVEVVEVGAALCFTPRLVSDAFEVSLSQGVECVVIEGEPLGGGDSEVEAGECPVGEELFFCSVAGASNASTASKSAASSVSVSAAARASGVA